MPAALGHGSTVPPHHPAVRNRPQRRFPKPAHTMHHALWLKIHWPQAPNPLSRIVIYRRKIVLQAALEQKIGVQAPYQNVVPGCGGDVRAVGGDSENGPE